MKRPIEPNKAVMWKRDDFAASFDRLKCSVDLHRYAGRRHSLSCLPKRSSIDGRYFAEINRYRSAGVMDFNIAMGKGETPVHAAIDGYAQVIDDPMWQAFALELACEMLRLAHERARRLDAKIDWLCSELEDLLDSGRSFVWDQP